MEREDGLHFVVGTLGDAGSGFVLKPGRTPRRLGLELVVPTDPEAAPGCAHLPRGPACRLRVARAELTESPGPVVIVDVRKTKRMGGGAELIEKKRGGTVELRVIAPLRKDGDLRLEITTFVRDVVTASALAGGPPDGDGGRMR